MDPMDIDSIVNVPEIPDRPAAGNISGKNSIGRGSNDMARIGLADNEKESRKCLIRAPGSLRSGISDNGSCSAAASGNSFSRNSFAFRTVCNNFHTQPAKSDKILDTISTVCQEASVEDLKEQNVHVNQGKKVVSCGPPGRNHALENWKRVPSAVQLHSQQSVSYSLLSSRINKGSESNKTDSAFGRSKGVDSNALTQPRAGKSVCVSPFSISSSRVTGQKRLVRNGRISPCNIAKAKQMDGMVDGGYSDTLHVSSSGPQAGVDAKLPVADAPASNVSKGKGIMTYPSSMKEPGGQNSNNRDTLNINGIVEEVDDSNKETFRSHEDLGGWRRTCNRSKKMNFSSAEENHLLPMDRSSSSSESPPMPPLRQRLDHFRSKSNQHTGDHPVTDMIQKRHKQGSFSSIQDDYSGSTFDDSGVVFFGSSGDTIESRPTRSNRCDPMDTIGRVIEIDGGDSGDRSDGSIGASSSNNEDAIARQIEADEMLARELQEQLYNEDVGVRVGLRSALTANPSRLPHVWNIINVPNTGSRPHASIHSRMERHRNRFPARPRGLSSTRERSSMFPAEVDVDLRMSILEALESFNDMAMNNSFLEIYRELNENHYEMLLALDENNHLHCGASTGRINDLPQSTVQNDNFEEACAVCLEMPATGDIIRHLPCLHKFHKDCIDPWLRRKSSCPVCKSSIT